MHKASFSPSVMTSLNHLGFSLDNKHGILQVPRRQGSLHCLQQLSKCHRTRNLKVAECCMPSEMEYKNKTISRCAANLSFCEWIPKVWLFKQKLLNRIFLSCSCGAVYYAVQGDSNFCICGWNPKVWPFKWILLNSTFLGYRSLYSTRWS